jgi:prenyltransferase beta subunit
MSVEGGFQGRTNKLVDSCYSFWQGSLFSLLTSTCQGNLFDPISQAEFLVFISGRCLSKRVAL